MLLKYDLICFLLAPTSGFSPDSGARKAAGLGRRKRGCNPLFGHQWFSFWFPSGSLRRRPSPGQDRTPGHPRPVRAVGRSRRLRGGAGGVSPCQSPWEAPGCGAGLPESPRPATGGTRTHTQSQDPGSRPVPSLRQGGRDREGAGQVNHGCQPPSGGSPPEAMTGFHTRRRRRRLNLVILLTMFQRGGDFPPLLIGGDNSQGIDAIRIQTTEYILAAIAMRYSGPNVSVQAEAPWRR